MYLLENCNQYHLHKSRPWPLCRQSIHIQYLFIILKLIVISVYWDWIVMEHRKALSYPSLYVYSFFLSPVSKVLKNGQVPWPLLSILETGERGQCGTGSLVSLNWLCLPLGIKCDWLYKLVVASCSLHDPWLTRVVRGRRKVSGVEEIVLKRQERDETMVTNRHENPWKG